MERFLASTFLFLSATSAVFAQGYDYNGDYMVLKAQGTDITIEYAFDQTNRPGPGTLFKGKILNNQVSGFAYVFVQGCNPVPYKVAGSFNRRWTTLRLTGTAPIVNRSCHVTGHSHTGPGTTLVFNADNRPITE